MQMLLEHLSTILVQLQTHLLEMRSLDGGIRLHNQLWIQAEGGEYLTKVDVFFSQKDENIPVTCQIRTMNTGYPTTKVLPFASKTLPPFRDGTVTMSNGSRDRNWN